jgi:hypothetical protein
MNDADVQEVMKLVDAYASAEARWRVALAEESYGDAEDYSHESEAHRAELQALFARLLTIPLS